MRKNVAGQYVAFQMNSTTDGSAVTAGTPTVYYTIDGGTQGTGAGSAVHEGNGQWSYAPAQAETNGSHVAFTMALSGAISQTVNVWPVSFNPGDADDLGLTALTGHTPQTGDSYARIGATGSGLTSLASAANLATVDTVVDGIQTDLDNATDGLGALKILIDAVKTDTAAILIDTNELQTDDVPGLIAALNDISVADVLTTQMTESYNTDGVAPTLAQAIFGILQFLHEPAYSGTTLTIKKLDGTTSAMTFTLDDSTSPTTHTRAT